MVHTIAIRIGIGIIIVFVAFGPIIIHAPPHAPPHATAAALEFTISLLDFPEFVFLFFLSAGEKIEPTEGAIVFLIVKLLRFLLESALNFRKSACLCDLCFVIFQ